MKTNTKRVAIVSGFLMLAAASAASALPPSEVQYNYYSDATYRIVVGSEHRSCDGDVTVSGRVTSYKREVSRSSC